MSDYPTFLELIGRIWHFSHDCLLNIRSPIPNNFLSIYFLIHCCFLTFLPLRQVFVQISHFLIVLGLFSAILPLFFFAVVIHNHHKPQTGVVKTWWMWVSFYRHVLAKTNTAVKTSCWNLSKVLTEIDYMPTHTTHRQCSSWTVMRGTNVLTTASECAL